MRYYFKNSLRRGNRPSGSGSRRRLRAISTLL